MPHLRGTARIRWLVRAESAYFMECVRDITQWHEGIPATYSETLELSKGLYGARLRARQSEKEFVAELLSLDGAPSLQSAIWNEDRLLQLWLVRRDPLLERANQSVRVHGENPVAFCAALGPHDCRQDCYSGTSGASGAAMTPTVPSCSSNNNSGFCCFRSRALYLAQFPSAPKSPSSAATTVAAKDAPLLREWWRAPDSAAMTSASTSRRCRQKLFLFERELVASDISTTPSRRRC